MPLPGLALVTLAPVSVHAALLTVHAELLAPASVPFHVLRRQVNVVPPQVVVPEPLLLVGIRDGLEDVRQLAVLYSKQIKVIPQLVVLSPEAVLGQPMVFSFPLDNLLQPRCIVLQHGLHQIEPVLFARRPLLTPCVQL